MGLAERGGFEPPIQVSPYAGLASRSPEALASRAAIALRRVRRAEAERVRGPTPQHPLLGTAGDPRTARSSS